MNADFPDKTTDRTLESDLEEIRSVLADPDSADPPNLLDTAVLNTARRELAANSQAWSRRFSLRWLGAFATASVMILALGLIVQQEQESGPLPNGGTHDATLENDAAPRAVEEVAQKRSLMKKADRDEANISRVAPMAASAPPSADFAVRESADEPAQIKEEADAVASPEEWVGQMLQLKLSDQHARLAEELAAFRATYPDYPLPPELSR
ncbi:hypothetical protein ACFL0N_00600 [Pseudomonadota bacterium]